MSGTGTLGQVRALVTRSEYVQAYDLARRAIAGPEDGVSIRHLGVLALARMGATGRAKRQFLDWRLDTVADDEDVLALWARLLKDQAQAASGSGRAPALLEAAAAYERSYAAAGGGYYPAVNVASLNCLAGRREAAERWAHTALAAAEGAPGYYALATVAEALVVLGDAAGARAALSAAVQAQGADLGAMATTRAQIGALVDVLGLDPQVLAPLAPPLVLHHCGHRVTPDGAGGRFAESELPRVSREIAGWFATHSVDRVFGSLAAGADILIAEAALAAGVALNVVLPFARGEFVDVSVRSCGADWAERFDRCMEAANAVHFVTDDAWLGDDELFAYASHLALGLALLRARAIGSELNQLAVWDGQPLRPGDRAGTASDLAVGRRLGLIQHIVWSGGQLPADGAPAAPAPAPAGSGRVRRTMVFGDLKGFSRLGDAQLPRYVETVLGACAGVLERQDSRLRFSNTWGDGLFLVFDDPAAAADCAFDLQAAVSGIDRAACGLPDDLGLRLGIHYGPVFEARDPVLGRTNCFGFHVSRAARVEPITPEGEVYVTEATAAALAVDASDRFRCDYVGRVPLAKGYGEFPMYSLIRHASAGAVSNRPALV